MHYTYEILEIPTQIAYIGVRTCKGEAIDDLGNKYISSSADKAFIKKQRQNPKNYRYTILRTFDTRKEATKHEIYLHNINDVGRNPKFYNRSKQAADGGFSDQCGSDNFASQAVQLNQWQFGTIKEASEQTGISTTTIRKYAKSKDYPNCKYIDEVTIINPPMDKEFWKQQRFINQSNALKGKPRPTTVGALHINARPIQLEQYHFGFIGDASTETGLGEGTIKYMIKSEDYPNCKYIDEVTKVNGQIDKDFWQQRGHLIRSNARKGIVNSPEAIEKSRQSLLKYYESHNSPMKGRKMTPEQNKANSERQIGLQAGANNPKAKKITINDKQYGCIKDAMEDIGKNRHFIDKRLKSPIYPNYQYI